MSVLRYSVLDENGIKINSILVRDPYPENYWPGYGRYITCDSDQIAPTPPENLEIKSDSNLFTYLIIRPNIAFDMGDSMNVETGEVTKKIEEQEIIEEISE